VRLLAGRPRETDGARAEDARDADLVVAAQSDPLAFDRLVARYDAPILNYCYYRLGTWEEAEDSAQEIFTKAYAGLPRFRDRDGGGTGSFRSWLFTIAHHEVANRKRGYARHPQTSIETASAVLDPGPTPEELAVAADRQGRVLALASRLSIDQRQVLELRMSGLTDVEIGAVLGRNPGAVRAVQARAIARLRELLDIRPNEKGGGDV
jgi:RNA polymerase sigma-70 factor (ECF subfamily)